MADAIEGSARSQRKGREIMKHENRKESNLPTGFRKLLGRLERGTLIWHAFSFIFWGTASVFIIGLSFPGRIPWAVTAFILGIVCRVTALLHVWPRYISASKVAENPQIVYWGHSTDPKGLALDGNATDSNALKLHLKDGTQLEVETARGTGVSQTQLGEIISWLRSRNPSMRWGRYDNA
jgi:hypothetical protein